MTRGDDEDEHAGAPFERVRDLQVGDVDAEARGQGGDLGDHAFAVEHRHPQLDQRLLGRQPGGQVSPRGAGVGEQREQRVAVAVGDDAADAAQLVGRRRHASGVRATW